MKKLSLLAIAMLFYVASFSQILDPVKWSYAAKKTSATEATIYIKATIQSGWHIYSQNIADGGPIKTSFTFNPSKSYLLAGKTIEPKPITKYEQTFKMNVSYFENAVIFQQKVKLKSTTAIVSGSLEFMACNDKQCLPPEEIKFSVPVK
ncbi:sugar transporter [Pedobacter sp. HMF7647]|uniref:Sugar transporter n=1 Tax=Hufsiella arboris TaxID=2695275 RepID=A0A7K1Y5F2_9SPHI|nr:protein-disulfide reductase DsbD N-terminal domain-containing protein [Hufsiella arboris]MXV49826.1 sugar transporter [Hufsiella arboris]